MSTAAAGKKTWTPEEYLAFERTATEKHAFLNGQIVAMAGASPQHNTIAGNLYASLWNALRRRPCLVFGSDMRVKVQATGLYTYPDVSVVCGAAQYDDAQGDVLINPVVICEVLSPSTTNYDRGEKFEHYRALPSLREYVVVAQDRVLVEHHARQTDNSWLLRELRMGHNLVLAAIGCEIPLEDLYLKVFPPQAAS